jgi:hypothetical protein
MISEPLVKELNFELNSPTLYLHPFFTQYGQINLSGVGAMCHQAVKTVDFAPGDVVFNDCESAVENEARNGMLWLKRGRLAYHQAGFQDVRHLEQDQWACEAVLWTRWMHCGTLRAAKETCIVLALVAKEFRKVLSTSPFPQATEYAIEYVKELNRNGLENHTDLNDASIVDQCMLVAFPEAAMDFQATNTGSARRDHIILGFNRGSGNHLRVSAEGRRASKGPRLSVPPLTQFLGIGKREQGPPETPAAASRSTARRVQVKPTKVVYAYASDGANGDRIVEETEVAEEGKDVLGLPSTLSLGPTPSPRLQPAAKKEDSGVTSTDILNSGLAKGFSNSPCTSPRPRPHPLLNV